MHARNIALYASGTTNFDTQGLGILRDALTCESTETAATNGNITYTLELTYPIGGYLADQLTNGNLIRAQVGSSSDDYMIFEIVNNVKADSGTITAYADAYPYRILRMSFDNGGIFGKYSSVQNALTALKSKITDFPSNFQLISGVGTSIDLTQAASTSASSSTTEANQQPTNWATFGDALNEIMNQISGQVEYGVNYIRIYSVRGADVDTTMLRDDKNTNGVSIKTDTENIVNRIIPMIPVIGSDGNATGAYKVGSIVTSSVAHNWINFWSAKVVQVTDQNYANNYFNITSCDRPTLTATVTTSMLDQNLSDVHLFDRLTVYSKRINYAAKLQISTRVFDNLTGEVSSFSLGSSAVTVFTQQQTTVNQIASLLQDTQYAIASANGKNTNYYGGTNPPANPSEGDYWFVKIDGVSYIKQYHAGNWEIIVSDATQDQIKQTVAQAVADGQDALSKANTAVDTANTANSSVQSAISAAQTASDDANNATTVANNAISQATSASTVANNVHQEVVTLKGGSTATLAELENGLALKLSTSDFNTQMANYATQTWTTNQITATSDSLSSTISRVQTQVNNSAVGTNLITNSNFSSGLDNWVVNQGTNADCKGTVTTDSDGDTCIHITGTGNDCGVWCAPVSFNQNQITTGSLLAKGTGTLAFTGLEGRVTSNFGTISTESYSKVGSTMQASSNTNNFCAYFNPVNGVVDLYIKFIKLEKGINASDWSANPADNATVISVSNITQKVDSLSTVVSGKVDNTTYTSKITELANSIATKVESSDYNSKMTQLDNAISAKVSSSDYTSQVNVLTNQINSRVSQTDWANSAVGANLLTGTSGVLQTVTNASGWNNNMPTCSSIVTTINSDTSYTARAWISPVSYDMQIQIGWTDASGNPHYDGGNAISANTSGYSTCTGVITAGGTIHYVTIVFTAWQSTASSVSYKEMKLEKGSYATPWCLAASEIANYSQIQQLSDNINLRVAKNDVVNQINISTESILIAGNKIHITGSTTIDDAAIGSAKISTLSASKVTGGTLDFSQITATNINANSITSGTLSGVAIHQIGSTYTTKLTNGSIYFEDQNGNNSVRMGPILDTKTNAFVGGAISVTEGRKFSIGQGNSDQSSQVNLLYIPDDSVYNNPYVMLDNARFGFSSSRPTFINNWLINPNSVQLIAGKGGMSLGSSDGWGSANKAPGVSTIMDIKSGGIDTYQNFVVHNGFKTYSNIQFGDNSHNPGLVGLGGTLYMGGTGGAALGTYNWQTGSTGGTFTVSSGGVKCYTQFNVYNGSKNAAMVTRDGVRLTPAYETAENYVGDIGEDNTGSGSQIRIFIDPLYLDMVNTANGYHVFVTPYSNSRIWVTDRLEDSFIVHSDQPNVDFSWEIKVHRRGYESERLEKSDMTLDEVQQVEETGAVQKAS